MTPPRPTGGPGRRRRGPRAGRPTVQKTSRAGRNLPAAIGVGVTLGAVLVASLYLYKPAFLGVLARRGRDRHLGGQPRDPRGPGATRRPSR